MDTAQQALFERAFSSIGDADIVGVAAVEDTRGTPLYESAAALLPGARSIVVMGAEVYPEVVGLVSPEKEVGHAVPGALYEPHVTYVCGRLNTDIYRLAKVYRREGYRALPLPAQGTPSDPRFLRGVISFKHAAEYAGLGRIGRSSLLITPQFGPRVRLGCLLTDAEMPSGRLIAMDPCSTCGESCAASCPAGALSSPDSGEAYAIDKFACWAFCTGASGCANCLNACPAGAR